VTTRSAPLVWRIAIGTLLLVGFVQQTRQQWRVIQAGTQPYLIGDWTISYAGGFVRRGLFGSLLTVVSSDAATALLALFVVQTLLYVIIFGVALLWVARLPDPRGWALVLLSPAFLLFGLADFGGTHRKEIIALAALMLLGETVRTRRSVPLALLVAVPLFGVAVLSHEANALLVVPFLILVRWSAEDSLLTRRYCDITQGVLIVLSVGGLAAALIAPGTVEQQSAICVDLVARGFSRELCDGALTYIGRGTSDALATVGARLPESALYAIPAAFAILPFTLVPWARAQRRTLLIASAPVVLLLGVGVDWGRWIMIAVVITTVLSVVGSSREGTRPESVPTLWVLLFILAWRVPHAGITPEGLGPSGIPGTLLDASQVIARRLGV